MSYAGFNGLTRFLLAKAGWGRFGTISDASRQQQGAEEFRYSFAFVIQESKHKKHTLPMDPLILAIRIC